MDTFLVTYKDGSSGVEYRAVFTTESLDDKIENLKKGMEDFRLVDAHRI